MRWPTKAVTVHFHLLHRSHLKIGYLDISVTSDFCDCQPLEIRLLHLANYCFTGTVIGKPLLGCLKAGSGDDFLHHGVDFIFSHGLYLLPNFVTGSIVVLYQEIKCTTPTQIGRSTAYVQTKYRQLHLPYRWTHGRKTCFHVTSNVWVSGVKLWSFPTQMWSSLSKVGVFVVHSVLLTVHCQHGQEIKEKSAKISSLIWRAEKVSRTSSEKWMKIY